MKRKTVEIHGQEVEVTVCDPGPRPPDGPTVKSTFTASNTYHGIGEYEDLFWDFTLPSCGCLDCASKLTPDELLRIEIAARNLRYRKLYGVRKTGCGGISTENFTSETSQLTRCKRKT